MYPYIHRFRYFFLNLSLILQVGHQAQNRMATLRHRFYCWSTIYWHVNVFTSLPQARVEAGNSLGVFASERQKSVNFASLHWKKEVENRDCSFEMWEHRDVFNDYAEESLIVYRVYIYMLHTYISFKIFSFGVSRFVLAMASWAQWSTTATVGQSWDSGAMGSDGPRIPAVSGITAL